MNSIDTKLAMEIERELDAINEMDVGSQEHEAAVKPLVQLMDRVIEMQRLDIEDRDKSEKRKAEERAFDAAERAREAEAQAREAAFEADERNKSEDREMEKHHRVIGYIVAGAGIIIPAAITIWGTKKSFKFEEVGTITTQAGREFMKRIFAKK